MLDAWHLYQQSLEKNDAQLPVILGNSELWGKPESSAMFFGREHELFELTEKVKLREKLFINGIGGIGKTELLRQLLYRFIREEGFANIVTVQYEENLSRSFISSFSSLTGEELSEKFHECIYLLQQADPESTVVLIDNASIRTEDLSDWQELAHLPCAVLVTSRELAPEPFRQMHLGALDERAAELMLRRHYGTVLDDEELQTAQRIAQTDALRHPLTIKLAARAASCNHWPMAEIYLRIRNTMGEIAWKDENVEYHLCAIYRELYRDARLTVEEKTYIRILSALPYQQYTPEELHAFCAPQFPFSLCLSRLDELSRKGWLEKKEQLYSLHPLIAECMRETHLPAETFQGLFTYASGVLTHVPLSLEDDQDLDSQGWRIIGCVIHVYDYIRDTLTLSQAYMILKAIIMLGFHLQINEREARIADDLLQRFPELPISYRLEAGFARAAIGNEDVIDLICKEFKHIDQADDDYRRQLFHITTVILFNVICMGFYNDHWALLLSLLEHHACTSEERLWPVFIHLVSARSHYQLEEAHRYFQEFERLYEASEPVLSPAQRNLSKQTYLKQVEIDLAMQDIYHAREHVQKGNAIPAEITPAITLETYLSQAMLARLSGEKEQAVSLLSQAREYCARYYGRSHLEYTMITNELAILLNSLGQHKEAIAYYEECIVTYRTVSNDCLQLSTMLNNKGVALLSAGRASDAVCALEEALSVLGQTPDVSTMTLSGADKNGDSSAVPISTDAIRFAEPWFNLAKAWRALGDASQERSFLLAARPVFETVYGPEHPKTQELLARLSALR